jgi:ATP-dependent exoDNAse (exonuclease V) beta subunit
MPSKWAKKAWEQEQEQNLIYVAYTRAKQKLSFIADYDGTESAK